jgi:hypothetical protein
VANSKRTRRGQDSWGSGSHGVNRTRGRGDRARTARCGMVIPAAGGRRCWLYHFEIVIEGAGGRGLQRVQPEPARLLQQRPHDRRDQAQHARGDPAARRRAARASRVGAAGPLSFVANRVPAGARHSTGSGRVGLIRVDLGHCRRVAPLCPPGNGATYSQGLMDHVEHKVNGDWLRYR